MTAWVFVAMLYTVDGNRHYSLGETFPSSDQCFSIAQAATKKLLESRMGWAMCVPESEAKKLASR